MSDQQHRFALEFLGQLPMDGWTSVLDIGAGPGYQTEWFLQQGKLTTAVDLTPPKVDVPYREADAHALPFTAQSVDAVWSHHMLEHVRDPLGVLLEMSRVLRPGGYLFLTVPDTDGVVSTGHINRYDMSLVVYHLAMCGFDTRVGTFRKARSHLRSVVQKIDTPTELDTNVRSLWDRGRLPDCVGPTVLSTGRFTRQQFA